VVDQKERPKLRTPGSTFWLCRCYIGSGIISAKPWGSTRRATVPMYLGTIPTSM